MARRMARRLGLLFLVAALPFALWTALPIGSGAQSSGDLQRQIERKRAQIEQRRGKERVLTTDISAISQRIGSLQGDITVLQTKQVRLETDLAAKREQLARSLGAKVYLVSAYEPVPEGRLRDERAQVPEDLQWMVNPREDVEDTLAEGAASLESQGVDVETLAREGDPADAILDVAEEKNADLIVIGNKGMTGAKRFLLGSVPNKVSHHAPCSVMIIRTT